MTSFLYTSFAEQSCAIVLFDQAREEAEALDKDFAKTNKLKGSLHGVPFSFKDQCEFAIYLDRSIMSDVC